MRRLWAQGFSDESPLRITEPIAWIPETKFLLQGRATGHALDEHLSSPEEGIARVRASGRWLAKLHGSDVGSASSPLPPRFEADKLTVYATALAEGYPHLGKQVQDTTAAVVGALTGTGNGSMVPTHGDYQPKNIYVTRRQTTVIDFDRHALAPPARDLAHFIGQCMTMSWVRTGSFDRIAAWNDAFLRAYTRRRGDGLELLPAYLARTFLEILYYKLVSNRWPTPASHRSGWHSARSGPPTPTPSTPARDGASRSKPALRGMRWRSPGEIRDH